MSSSKFPQILTTAAMCAVLFTSGAGAPASPVGSARIHLFAASPRLEPVGDRHEVLPRIQGFGSISRPGEPMLPLQILLVAIPEGSVPELSILSERSESLGKVPIAPVPRVRVAERLEQPRGAALHRLSSGKPSPAAGPDRWAEEGLRLQGYENDFARDETLGRQDKELPPTPVRLGRIGYLRQQPQAQLFFT